MGACINKCTRKQRQRADSVYKRRMRRGSAQIADKAVTQIANKNARQKEQKDEGYCIKWKPT